uniref:Uncharacterized protein n=1 Tax=Romanomermis culicivorax TaxID=13658 RepID=A0A915JED3_ROMCU
MAGKIVGLSSLRKCLCQQPEDWSSLFVRFSWEHSAVNAQGFAYACKTINGVQQCTSNGGSGEDSVCLKKVVIHCVLLTYLLLRE